MSQRTRTKGNIDSLEVTVTQTDGSGNTTVSTTNLTGANGHHELMRDTIIPRFTERSGKGQVFVNGMYQLVTDRSAGGTLGGYSFTHILNDISYSDGYVILRPEPNGLGKIAHLDCPLDIPNMMTEAGTQAASNVASPEFAGLVFLGELRETVRFLRNPLKAFLDAVKRARSAGRRAKRRNRTYASTVLDYIAEQWLSYRYGIMPIVYDIEDAVKAIDSLKEKPERFTARGAAYGSASNSLTVGPKSWGPHKISKDISSTRRVEVRAGVLYTHSVRDTFGLSPQQVPAALWELVPFSFVADWFFNVGDYIGAITPKIGVDVLGSWTTVRDDRQSEGTGSSTWDPPSGNYVNDGSPTSLESFKTLETRRLPGIHVGLVSNTQPLSSDWGQKRVLDLVALTRGVLLSPLR